MSLVAVAHALNVTVEYRPVSAHIGAFAIGGRLVVLPSDTVGTIRGRDLRAACHRRFLLAHELGHIVMQRGWVTPQSVERSWPPTGSPSIYSCLSRFSSNPATSRSRLLRGGFSLVLETLLRSCSTYGALRAPSDLKTRTSRGRSWRVSNLRRRVRCIAPVIGSSVTVTMMEMFLLKASSRT